MAYQHRVLGVKDFDRNLRAITRMVGGDEMANALEDGAWVIVLEARRNIVSNGLVDTREMHDKTRPRKVNQYTVDVIVDVPYGAVHEYGLQDQVITERQRRFFWAKYIETGDDMWKALALSVTYTIPARPFLRPAVDTKKKEAFITTAAYLENRMRRLVK